MTNALYRLRPDPSDANKLVLRPFMGGPDLPFNTRWRDVTIGTTRPNATNTGVLPGSTLRVVSGDQTLTTPGVYRDIDFQGHVYCRSMGLEFYNCRFRGGTDGLNLVDCTRPSTFALFVDCTFRPDVVGVNRNGIFGGNFTLLRCQFSNCTDFIGVATPTFAGDPATPDGPTNVQILACYGFDFLYYSPDPSHPTDNATHNDGVQIHGGAGTLVDGCHWDMTESAASVVGSGGHSSGGLYGQGVTITPVVANITGVIVRRNWFNHGKHGFIAVGSPYTLSVTVEDNRFGAVVPYTLDGVTAQHRAVARIGDDLIGFPAVTGPDATNGNVNDEDGSPVTIWRTAV